MKKHNIMLLISIVIILCIVVVIVVWSLKKESLDTPNSDDAATTTIPLDDGLSENNIFEPDESTEKYTVAFFDSAGNLLKNVQVDPFTGTEPPDNFVPDADKIFMGWDKDFSFIFSNTNIRPNNLDISADKNYVYANAVYAKPETEVRVNVKIGGQVNFAALQMYIDYDEKLLEYINAVNLDSGVMINKEEENPRLRLAFLSDDNVTGAVDFVELVFRVKGAPGDKAVIMYDIEKAAMINDGEIIPADYTVKDTVIHIY